MEEMQNVNIERRRQLSLDIDFFLNLQYDQDWVYNRTKYQSF